MFWENLCFNLTKQFKEVTLHISVGYKSTKSTWIYRYLEISNLLACCKIISLYTGNGHNGGGSWEGSSLLDRVAQRNGTKIKANKRNDRTRLIPMDCIHSLDWEIYRTVGTFYSFCYWSKDRENYRIFMQICLDFTFMLMLACTVLWKSICPVKRFNFFLSLICHT